MDNDTIKLTLPLDKLTNNQLNRYKIQLSVKYSLGNHIIEPIDISNLDISPNNSFTLNNNIAELSEIYRLGREQLKHQEQQEQMNQGELISNPDGLVEYLSNQIGGFPNNLITDIQSISNLENVISRLGKINLTIS